MFLSQLDLFLIPMFPWSLGLEVSLQKFPFYSHFREDNCSYVAISSWNPYIWFPISIPLLDWKKIDYTYLERLTSHKVRRTAECNWLWQIVHSLSHSLALSKEFIRKPSLSTDLWTLSQLPHQNWTIWVRNAGVFVSFSAPLQNFTQLWNHPKNRRWRLCT